MPRPSTAPPSARPSRASSASPAECPNASLYALKPSRSKNSSARVLVGVDQGVLEVVHELPPVGEPAEPVGERLLVAAPQQQQVLAEGQAAARHRGKQAGDSEYPGERGQIGDPAVEEKAERDEGAPGAPARDAEGDAHAAEQQQVPDGIPSVTATASGFPSVACRIGPNSSAVTSAASVRPLTAPSSQSDARSVRRRARSSITRPT